jgi:hypothetical protein
MRENVCWLWIPSFVVSNIDVGSLSMILEGQKKKKKKKNSRDKANGICGRR